MGWVVTRWRTDRLAALLDEGSRASARRVLWEAERDAYRVRAAAARESSSAATTLDAIERLGVELRDGIRLYRAAAGPDPLAGTRSPPIATAQPFRQNAAMPEPFPAAAAADGPSPAFTADAPPEPAPLDPADADAPPPAPLRAARLSPLRRPRPGRASLRDSPLADMMRAGAAR